MNPHFDFYHRIDCMHIGWQWDIAFIPVLSTFLLIVVTFHPLQIIHFYTYVYIQYISFSPQLSHFSYTFFNLNFNFSRVIASLDRVMSRDDIAGPVLDALKREFSGMMKKKTQQYVDNKVRNVRYLAELVKFGVAPPIVAFRMFKTMMTDFSPHNIELTAILLENCGR